MGFWSSVGSFLSGVGNAIGSVCKAVGGIMGSTLGKLATAISPWLGIVGAVVNIMASLLNVGDKEMEPEDYALAAEQFDKKPDDFDSINDYIDALSKEIKEGRITLDKSKLSKEQLDGYKAVGYGLLIKGIDEKYGVETDGEFWKMAGSKFEQKKLDEKELDSLLKTSSQTNVSPDDITSYIDNTELSGEVSASDVSSTIESALQEAHPERSQTDIADRFNDLLKKDD